MEMVKLHCSKAQPNTHNLAYILLEIMLHFIYSSMASSCNSRLLSDRVRVPDTAFEHSSAVNLQHGAAAARDDPTDISLQERAWCPDAFIHTELREFIQIDLGRQTVIKLIITKGRVAQSKGRQTTPYFYVKYQRERTGSWFEYRKENGTQRLNGNQDAMTENYNTMEPSFVARYIRIYPFSLEPTKTCLKLELLGCDAHGVVEYQIPQGSLLSDSIMSSYTYESRKLTGQTRFLDNSYDAQVSGSRTGSPADFRRLGYHQIIPSPVILRGGLGKLTDGDVELIPRIGPFSSFKYVGWRRPKFFTRKRRQNLFQTASPDIYTGSATTPLDLQLNEHYVPLLFRFDGIYNFTHIRLFLANDFRNGSTCPKNITIQILMAQTPSELDSVLVYEPRPNRTNWNSRWITLSMSTSPTDDDTDGSVLHPKILKSSRDSVQHPEDKPSTSGRFVVLKLFFDSEWILLGEVEFGNYLIDETIFQNHHPNSEPAIEIVVTPEVASTTESTEIPKLLFESSFSHGRPTTYTLIAVCGILALLILVGLSCLICLWRQKRLRAPFDGRFQRGKKRTNGSTQFDCLNESQLLASHLSNHTNDHQKTAALMDLQTKFQHPLHCQQDLNKTVANSSAFAPALQMYSNTLGPNFSYSSTQSHPNVASGILVNMDPNLPLPICSNGPLISTTPVTVTNGFHHPNEVMQFLPLSNTQVRCLTSYHPGQAGSNNTMRKVLPENAVYTTLPESDGDSQPYARIGNGGDSLRGINQNALVNDRDRLPFNFSDGRMLEVNNLSFLPGQSKLNNALLSKGLLPPPPSLPLPPLPPQHFSPSPSQGSASLTAEEFGDSGVPLMSSDTKDPDCRWFPQTTITNNHLPMNNHAFVRGGLNPTEQMIVNQLSNFKTLPGSEYSSTTLGSLSNPYGPYYGAPGLFPLPHGQSGLPTHPSQIRR